MLTRSEDGSVILRGTETVTVEAVPAKVVDTTGAGDAYAAEIVASLRGRCRVRVSDPDGRALRRGAKAERDAARRARPVQPEIPGTEP